MSLDKETVRRIATLARIRIEENALEPLAGELNNILGWVEQLEEVDTDGVPPMTSVARALAGVTSAQPPMTSVVETTLYQRRDDVNDGDVADDILANAPEKADHFFVVPKVIE